MIACIHIIDSCNNNNNKNKRVSILSGFLMMVFNISLITMHAHNKRPVTGVTDFKHYPFVSVILISFRSFNISIQRARLAAITMMVLFWESHKITYSLCFVLTIRQINVFFDLIILLIINLSSLNPKFFDHQMHIEYIFSNKGQTSKILYTRWLWLINYKLDSLTKMVDLDFNTLTKKTSKHPLLIRIANQWSVSKKKNKNPLINHSNTKVISHNSLMLMQHKLKGRVTVLSNIVSLNIHL